jgi:purine nucleosidase
MGFFFWGKKRIVENRKALGCEGVGTTRSSGAMRRAARYCWLLALGLGLQAGTGTTRAQSLQTAVAEAGPQLVIIDTDIGDDVDDAFALGLALQSPELKILGITTAWGNTPLRAKLVSRFLQETGRTEIPIAMGIEKYPAQGKLNFSQTRYAERGPHKTYPAAVDFLLEQIRQHPGEITLIAIGPETNLGAAIERDPETFRKLKRIVLMGGSVYRGYDGFAYATSKPQPQPEWNILCDIPAAQKVFASGVPLYVMPLDSTQIKLQELERARLFSSGTAITDALTVLYHQWSWYTNQTTPTLYDPVAVAYAIKPELCPTTPLRLRVDEQGSTKVETGTPNAQVCLRSDSDQFLAFYMARIVAPVRAGGGAAK